MVWRRKVLTHRQLTDRSRRLANFFLARGLGHVTPRAELQSWESGQDFVGVLSHNRPEYIEATFGAFKARCVPFNINFRYGPAEMRELFAAAPTRALVYEAPFADVVAAVRADLPPDVLLIEVGGGGAPQVEGALDYEAVLEGSSGDPVAATPSPDDLYVLFTGGTTGRPKAVLWRQGDAYVINLGGPRRWAGEDRPYEELVLTAIAPRPRVALPAPPFMHGGGQWVALTNILSGDLVAIQDVVDHLDCADIWKTVERERVNMMLVTGNAHGVPLLEELAVHDYDLESLRAIVTGAVLMTAEVKEALLAALPGVQIVETVGATESGTHLRNVARESAARRKSFM